MACENRKVESRESQTQRSSTGSKTASLEAIRQGIDILFAPGQVVEVRALSKYGVTTGYFDDFATLAEKIKELSDSGKYDGVYYTLNSCNPALLARRTKNDLHERADSTTTDGEIVKRSWLPVDCDPRRPKGISSTREELMAAKGTLEVVRLWLSDQGWPDPVVGRSGNGYHGQYCVDEPNDKETAQLFADCLAVLSKQFSTDKVDIDRKMFNASRIIKAYGSLARKGDSTPDRPHRYSKLYPLNAPVQRVTRAQLKALAATLHDEKEKASNDGSPHTKELMEEFLKFVDIEFKPATEMPGGGTKWIIAVCPFNPEHTNDPAVFLRPNGAFGYHCFHDSCGDKKWKQFREAIERTKRHKFHFIHEKPIGDYRSWNGSVDAEHKRPRSLEEVRQDIETLLYAPRKGNPGLPAKEQAPALVTNLIWSDLNDRGEFFRDARRDIAYLSLPDSVPGTSVPKVLEVSDNHWFAAMLDQFYHVQIADPLTRRIASQLENRTMTAAERKRYQVHELGQYDAERNELYLCVGDQIICIGPEELKVVPNGHDHRFFVPNATYTAVDAQAVVDAATSLRDWEHGLNVEQDTLLIDYLFRNVPFDEDGALSPKQARQIIFAGVLTLPFGDSIGEKPIFSFIGDEDSGKSSLQRKIGYLIYGTIWDTVSSGQEARDFDTALVRNYLLAVDDVGGDGREAKENAKKLGRCATGGYVTFRVMRSNAEERKLPFTAWIWTSGLSVMSHEPDYLSRLIPISFRGELPAVRHGRAEIQQFVEKNRVKLLGEYIKRLQMVVRGIQNQRLSANGIEFRMADWTKIIGAAAKDEGLLTEFIDLFRAIKGERLTDAENDPLMKPIRTLFASKPDLNGKEMRIDVLEGYLKEVACEYHFTVHCLTDLRTASTYAFSRALTKVGKVLLRRKYGFKEERRRPYGSTNKIRYVTFNLSERVMAEVRQWAQEYSKAGGPRIVDYAEALDV